MGEAFIEIQCGIIFHSWYLVILRKNFTYPQSLFEATQRVCELFQPKTNVATIDGILKVWLSLVISGDIIDVFLFSKQFDF